MTWSKVNLVTARDGSDTWECTDCGFKKKYFGLRRDLYCPKCKATPVFGCWSTKTSKCGFCESKMIVCPKEGHPNSEYWNLQQNKEENLYVCPKGCLEDGSKIFQKTERIKAP